MNDPCIILSVCDAFSEFSISVLLAGEMYVHAETTDGLLYTFHASFPRDDDPSAIRLFKLSPQDDPMTIFHVLTLAAERAKEIFEANSACVEPSA